MPKESFVGGLLRNMDIEKFHASAEKTLNQSKFNEENFIPPYTRESVDADLAKVSSLKKVFKENNKSTQPENVLLGTVFESIVLSNGELSNWFGENATTMKTADFDDIYNKIDAVIEFQGNEPGTASYVGMAADVTFSHDTTKKFDNIQQRIDNGQLGMLKYFHSEHMNFHGQLSKIPEVVLGVEKKTVLELAELQAGRKFKELANHPVQIMILSQMEAQMETFALYSESIGKNDLAAIFRSRLVIIRGILETKKDLVAKTKYEINDSVHSSIMEFLAHKKKTLSR